MARIGTALIPAVALLIGAVPADAEEKVYRGAKALFVSGAFAKAVHVDLADEDYPSKYRDTLTVLPNLRTLVVGGPRFTDWYLKDLARLKSLRVVILDSADVTDGAVGELRRSRPDLTIYRSQRRAIEEIRKLALEAVVITRTNDDHPDLAELIGERYFEEATEVDFSRLPDDESGPFDKILNEELAPLRMLRTVETLDLTWSRINDGGLHYLKNLSKLESLRIPLDELSPEARKRVREMRPWKKFEGTLETP